MTEIQIFFPDAYLYLKTLYLPLDKGTYKVSLPKPNRDNTEKNLMPGIDLDIFYATKQNYKIIDISC